jgi:hypothetical protein
MMKTAAVVVSHYNAWPTDQLVALLDQIRAIPAGHPFATRVVVNRAEDRPLELPARHSDVAIFCRENRGYNIGAWDHGWRQSPPADFYLFLQEECILLKPGWLRAFVRAASNPKVGLVGESISLWKQTWDDVDHFRKLAGVGSIVVYGQEGSWAEGTRMFLARHGIKAGPGADHLQSLVIGARREVLEKIGGFPIGDTKDEAICSEVAMSKAVQAIGLEIRQVGLQRFTQVHHPQWEADRAESSRPAWILKRMAETYLPDGLLRLRKTLSRSKSRG